jgi:hypothetical protein
MKYLSKYEGFSTNEEINYKGIAAGAMTCDCLYNWGG